MERIKNLSKALFVALTLCAAVATPSWSQAPPAPGECGYGSGQMCRSEESCTYTDDGSECTGKFFYYHVED